MYFFLAIRSVYLVRIGMDISVFLLQIICTKKFPTLSIVVYFDFLLDRNGLLSCAERSAQWPILAPQAISKSLWQPSRSSGFLDFKHLSPPNHKSMCTVSIYLAQDSAPINIFLVVIDLTKLEERRWNFSFSKKQ